MRTEFLFAQSTVSIMTLISKRACVDTINPEDESLDYNGDSDKQGMSSAEESELDHLLDNEEQSER